MKALVGSFVAAVVFFGVGLAADERGNNKPKEENKSVPPPPRAVYQHTTFAGRLGKFDLDGKQGKADYYFNGRHHQDNLVYVRSTEMKDPSLSGPTPGWVYQVSREGKK